MPRLPESLTTNLALPIVAAPMFLVSGPGLVTAACQAGIIGSFPATNARTVAILDEWLDSIASMRNSDKNRNGNAIWAISLFTHQSYARLNDELELVRRYKPPLVTTALGSPTSVIEAVHAYGGYVFSDVSSIKFAKRAIKHGVDGLILVCSGAGGHTGHLSPFAFVPSVREFWNGPLVVGGAISDGRTVRALQVLGADLAYMGTRFISAKESMASDLYREMVVHADADDLIATNAFTGVVANMLIPSIVRAGLDPYNLSPSENINFEDPHDIKNVKPWKDIWSAGQGVGHVKKVESVSEIVDQLTEEYVSTARETYEDLPWPGLCAIQAN